MIEDEREHQLGPYIVELVFDFCRVQSWLARPRPYSIGCVQLPGVIEPSITEVY